MLMPADARPSGMSRALDALVGAAVTVVLAPFIWFSPLLGGAVSGYLSPDDALPVGVLSGLFALVPLLFLLGLVGLAGLGFGILAPVVAGLTLAILAIVFVFLVGYVVVLSAIGGIIGGYLEREIT